MGKNMTNFARPLHQSVELSQLDPSLHKSQICHHSLRRSPRRFAPSLQLMQVPLEHMPLKQSAFTMQDCVRLHAIPIVKQSAPPQSMSVSPFPTMLSAHATYARSVFVSSRHKPVDISHLVPVTQSESTEHPLPILQRTEQVPPPQSTPVSAPSSRHCTRRATATFALAWRNHVQCGRTGHRHILDTVHHRSQYHFITVVRCIDATDTDTLNTFHYYSRANSCNISIAALHRVPPQSTLVSSPFKTPSEQLVHLP